MSQADRGGRAVQEEGTAGIPQGDVPGMFEKQLRSQVRSAEGAWDLHLLNKTYGSPLFWTKGLH